MIKIKTDDHSFRKFLDTIGYDCLLKHAKENLYEGVIVKVIIENKYMHRDCIYLMAGVEVDGPPGILLDLLNSMIVKTDCKEHFLIMTELFSKKLIADTLLNYSNEADRLSIIRAQNEWNNPINQTINYN